MGNRNSANSYLIQGHTTNVPLKPLFPRSIKWRFTDPVDFAYLNKLRPKLLSHINFSNNKAQKLRGKAIRSLRRILIDTKRSSNLHIEDTMLNPKQLHHLLNSSNHLKKIMIYPTENGLHNNHSSNSLRRVGRNKDLSELVAFYPNNEQEDDTYHLRQQLKQLRKLEYLNLDLPFCKSEIILSLQPLRFLEFFEISFIKQSLLPNLLSNLSKCDRLTELNINMDYLDEIDLQGTQLWNSFFQKAQSLKSLTFSRSFSANQVFSCFKVFPKCFKEMKHLATLKVHLDIPVFYPDHDDIFFIDFIFDSLRSLPQLKKLQITIDGNFVLKNSHFKNLASALGYLKNLHTLDLNIIRLESPSEVVASVANNIKNLSCLKHFKLKLTKNKYSNLTYKIVKNFAKSLTYLPLKSLDLTLSDQPIDFSHLISKQKVPLLSALSSLKNLTSLYLDLSAFTPEKWKSFYLDPKNLRKLTSLSVVVGQFNFTNNFKNLSKLMKCLKSMPNLDTLKLELSGEIVCDQEFDLLARNLDGCPNLHSLELSFHYADYLSEKALHSLHTALVKLTKLEYLEVNIWRSQRFANESINQFLCGLIVLKRLKELVANFERSLLLLPNFNWKENVQKLKNCKYLTKIEINHVRYLSQINVFRL